MLFGRPAGPVRVILGFVALSVFATLGITIYRIGDKLNGLAAGAETTLDGSGAIVRVNDKVTERLAQLTDLTGVAQLALDETRGLTPLLTQLADAVRPATAQVAAGRVGGEASEATLREIEKIVVALENRAAGLLTSAQAFGGQQTDLLGIVEALVADVEASLADARRINEEIPG